MQSYFAPVYEQVKAHGIFIDRAHKGIPSEIRRWTMDDGRWTMDKNALALALALAALIKLKTEN